MLRYDIFYLVAALLTSPVLVARLLRGGKWKTDWRGRFGQVDAAAAGGAASTPSGRATSISAGRGDVNLRGGATPAPPTVLVHGVSVGEVAATRELVARLAGPARVVVSATTDTGVARARSLYGTRHPVVRYPFDLSWMVRRFLDAVQPDAVVLTELEVWPNFVTECTRRGVPVCVVNGRLSAASYRGYRRARGWVGPVFGQLAAVAAQHEVYARRFADLGVPPERVEITGTMKWDTSGRPPSGPAAAARAQALAGALGIDRSRPIIVAGSTGPGEEQELIATRPPAAQLLLVPRKPERFDAVAALHPAIRRRSHHRGDAATGDRTGRRDPDGPPTRRSRSHHRAAGASAHPPADPATAAPAHPPADPATPTDLFLLDTMGELELAYGLADIAIVGRSFVPMGGSDPIPAVAAGCPTLIGPHHDNFAEVVAALEAGGGIVVTDSPMEAATRLLEDPKACRRLARNGQRVIGEHRGASARSAEMVLGLLST